jgi:hypothetical protein
MFLQKMQQTEALLLLVTCSEAVSFGWKKTGWSMLIRLLVWNIVLVHRIKFDGANRPLVKVS